MDGYFYGDLFKLMGIIVGVPFGVYLLYLGRKEKSLPATMHALGWILFLMALTPGESFIFQRIFASPHELFTFQKMALSLSGLCMTVGVSTMVYMRDPKKLMYLGGLSLILILEPIYDSIGRVLFSGEPFKRFTEVLHTAQYGYLLLILGIMIWRSSQEKDFRRFGLFYISLGAALLVYPFAKGVSLTLRALDIFTGFIIGIGLLMHLSKIIRSKIEIIIPEKTPSVVGMKKVTVADREKAKELLLKFESFPVLAFVREPVYPEPWKVHIITNATMENAIFPTDLALINELCVRYMREIREKGGSGVIYINCVEYLKVYNPFNSILKLLNSVRDYAILYNGTVIIEIDERAWEERELALLKGLEI